MKLFYIITLLLLVNSAYSQDIFSSRGAHSAGMGFTNSCTKESWALFNNPAGIHKIDGLNSLFSFENKYGIEGLNTVAAGLCLNNKLGSLGLGVTKFGDNLYSEQMLSLAIANKFGMASLGLRINYIQFHIDDVGSTGSMSVDFGGIAELTPQLLFGAYIRNINQAQLGSTEEYLPTILQTGISYQAGDKVTVNMDLQKEVDGQGTYRVGLQYQFLPKFSARMGINTNPFSNYFGLGFKNSKLSIDYSFSRDIWLGFSHQTSLTYKIKA